MRALTLPHGGKAMLSDTVGFISNLPTQLVAAFRATLEEVLEADIILHVRDISHEDADAQERDVDTVLRQLGIDPTPDSAFSKSGTRSTVSIPKSAKTCEHRGAPSAGAPVFPRLRRNRRRRRCAARPRSRTGWPRRG